MQYAHTTRSSYYARYYMQYSVRILYSSMHTVLEYLVDNMHIVCIVALATLLEN